MAGNHSANPIELSSDDDDDDEVLQTAKRQNTAGDEALARRFQLEEEQRFGASSLADDEALARRLQQEEQDPSDAASLALAQRLQASERLQASDSGQAAGRHSGSHSADRQSGGSGAVRCRYGASCKFQYCQGRTLGRCKYLHRSREEERREEEAEAARRMASRSPPPRVVFDAAATPLWLNRLGDDAAKAAQLDEPSTSSGDPHCCASPPEISSEQLVWWQPFVRRALFGTFGVDYDFVRRLLAGSPATAEPGGVAVCVSPDDHTRNAAGVDHASHAPWAVVSPPFYDDAASTRERNRLKKGTMHPKLWVLEMRGEGEADAFLRVGIFSSNLGAYDSQINNCFWVHDFPLLPADAGPASPSRFGTDLLRFVEALLRPSEELTLAWRTIFAKYDLTPPAGTHIISSIPGAYRTEDHGADALRRWLKHTLRQRAPDRRPVRVEYCFSSMGWLENKLVWQPLKRALLAGAAEGAEVRLVWPAMATMLATMASRESRRQWWADAHGLVGPGEQWIEANWEPRAHFSHHIMPWQHRAKTYHHAKVAAGLSASGELVWLYQGSHNCSGAAWGKRQVDAHGTWESLFMSYELGVLFIPPSPLPAAAARRIVPWCTPAKDYGPGTVPYSAVAVGGGMSGTGPFEAAAEADVAAAAAAARSCGEALPRLLGCPLGELRRLVRLRVESERGVSLLPRVPVPPPSRKSLLLDADFHGDLSGCFRGGEWEPLPEEPGGSFLLASEAASFSLRAARTSADAAVPVRFYRCVGGSGFVADRVVLHNSPDWAKPVLSVASPPGAGDGAAGGPPGGFLVALLAADEAANAPLLRLLSEARAVVDERCWGVSALQPSAMFTTSWRAGLSSEPEPPQPSHSDLVALEYGVEALPCLLLLAPDGQRCLVMASPLEAAAAGGVEALLARSLPELQLLRKQWAEQQGVRELMGHVPELYAASAAQMLHHEGIRLVVWQVEGCLKAAVNVQLAETAAAAGTKRHDAFQGYGSRAVPLLRQLLRAGGASEEGVAALRSDAPAIAFVSDQGHRCTDPAVGARGRLSEAAVRDVARKLVRRVANEIRVGAEALEGHVRWYHSFLSPAAPRLAESDPRRGRREWSREYARPSPGQLHHAMEDSGVPPAATLLVSYDDRDEAAADAAGVSSIRIEQLCMSPAPLSQLRRPGASGGGMAAPDAFVPR